MMRWLAISTPLVAFAATAVFAADWSTRRSADAVIITDPRGAEVLRYQLQPIAGSRLAVQSACYFHPVRTPSGATITDVAPSDHLHHRGIFLAWVEMHGKKDADFWGWGEHAPITNRTIVNRSVKLVRGSGGQGRFEVENEWLADTEPMIHEKLQVSMRQELPANILDLTYTLAPRADVKLSQWAFSGFCVRAPKDGTVEAFGPDGPVLLKNPKHTEPGSDWPDAPWYAYTLKLAGGQKIGVAVLNHTGNPRTLWHNHRDIRMLNPCIVAPQAITLKANEPLILRYRVVLFDGELPSSLLATLSGDYARTGENR